MLTNKEFFKLLHDIKDISGELSYFDKHIKKLRGDLQFLADKCDKLYDDLEVVRKKSRNGEYNAEKK